MNLERRYLRWLSCLALLGASGCAFGNLFTPGSHGTFATGATGPGGAGSGGGVAPAAAPGGPGWQAPAPGGFGPGARNGPPQHAPLQQAPGGYPGAVNEQVAGYSERIAHNDEDRRTLFARTKQLENQIREKDRALAQASLEIQEATTQVAKTREELQRWKHEMEGLRGKLRNAEHDNKTTLETIIRTLEQFLDRERQPAEALNILPGVNTAPTPGVNTAPTPGVNAGPVPGVNAGPTTSRQTP